MCFFFVCLLVFVLYAKISDDSFFLLTLLQYPLFFSFLCFWILILRETNYKKEKNKRKNNFNNFLIFFTFSDDGKEKLMLADKLFNVVRWLLSSFTVNWVLTTVHSYDLLTHLLLCLYMVHFVNKDKYTGRQAKIIEAIFGNFFLWTPGNSKSGFSKEFFRKRAGYSNVSL